MKKIGYIILVFGILSFIGCLSARANLLGPIFWIGLGIFLLYRANQKKKNQEEKDKWNSQ